MQLLNCSNDLCMCLFILQHILYWYFLVQVELFAYQLNYNRLFSPCRAAGGGVGGVVGWEAVWFVIWQILLGQQPEIPQSVLYVCFFSLSGGGDGHCDPPPGVGQHPALGVASHGTPSNNKYPLPCLISLLILSHKSPIISLLLRHQRFRAGTRWDNLGINKNQPPIPSDAAQLLFFCFLDPMRSVAWGFLHCFTPGFLQVWFSIISLVNSGNS